MLYEYFCKKTNETTTVDVESLPKESLEYAIRRGLREYFDNYHASVTTKEHGDKTAELVRPMVAEAFDRLMAGDVPGTRAPADPNTAKIRAAIKASGVDLSSVDPAELVKALQKAVARKAA